MGDIVIVSVARNSFYGSDEAWNVVVGANLLRITIHVGAETEGIGW
jgi:hypothetical protein